MCFVWTNVYSLVKVMKINDLIPNLSLRLSLTHESWINDPLARRWEYILISKCRFLHRYSYSFLDKYVNRLFFDKLVDKKDFLKNIDLYNYMFHKLLKSSYIILRKKGITSHFNLNLILCYLFFMFKNLLLPSKPRWSTDKISVIPLRRVSCYSKGSQLWKSKFTIFLFIKEPSLFSDNVCWNHGNQRFERNSIRKWTINNGLQK